MMRKRITLAVAAMLLLATTCFAQQAPYPNRPIKMIVSFAPGSVTDIMSRQYAEKLKDEVGQTIVVDNKPGATGAIGADLTAKAAADGYTIVVNSSALVINPWLVKQPFDFFKDLTPIARTANSAYVLTVNPKLPIANLDDFIAFAKMNPGKLLCATYGIASPPHIALELLKREAGIDVVHVPYKTFGQAYPDLVSGQLSCSLDPPTLPAVFAKEGKIRAVAQTGTTAMSLFPHIDAIGKKFPGATVVGWQAVFARADTPQPILARLRSDWKKILSAPEMIAKITEFGFEPANEAIEAFEKTIRSDYEAYGRIIKERNIRAE